MKPASLCLGLALALLTGSPMLAAPRPLDMDAASAEVSSSYGKAHPEVQEFVLHTARSFGRDGLWLNANAYADLKPAERDARITYLAKLFDESEYGRHLCAALAEASALKDPKLVPGPVNDNMLFGRIWRSASGVVPGTRLVNRSRAAG